MALMQPFPDGGPVISIQRFWSSFGTGAIVQSASRIALVSAGNPYYVNFGFLNYKNIKMYQFEKAFID